MENEYVVAIWNYDKEADNELTFEAGDVLKILETYEGWSMGENQRSEEKGLFPSNYIRDANNDEKLLKHVVEEDDEADDEDEDKKRESESCCTALTLSCSSRRSSTRSVEPPKIPSSESKPGKTISIKGETALSTATSKEDLVIITTIDSNSPLVKLKKAQPEHDNADTKRESITSTSSVLSFKEEDNITSNKFSGEGLTPSPAIDVEAQGGFQTNRSWSLASLIPVDSNESTFKIQIDALQAAIGETLITEEDATDFDDDIMTPMTNVTTSTTIINGGDVGMNNKEEASVNPIEDTGKLQKKMLEQRSHIINEIIKTETSYVNSLRKMLYVYRDRMKYSNIPEALNLFNNHHISVLFTTWEQMYYVNSLFLKRLRQRKKEQANEQIILLGDIFSEFAPFFNMYGIYASRHNEALKAIRNAFVKTPAIQKALLNEDGGAEFESLLIKPIQRVPRYLLLIKDLKKRTPEDMSEFRKLEKALQKMSETASSINSAVENRDRYHKLLELQAAFSSATENLVATHRVLLLHSQLTKYDSRSDPAYLHYFLLNDILIVGSNDTFGGYKLNVETIIDLKQIEIIDIPDIPDRGVANMFQVLSLSYCFILKCQDGAEKQGCFKMWKTAIQNSFSLSCITCLKCFRPDSKIAKCASCHRSMHRNCFKQEQKLLKIKGEIPTVDEKNELSNETPASAILKLINDADDVVICNGCSIIWKSEKIYSKPSCTRSSSSKEYSSERDHKVKLAKLQVEIQESVDLNLVDRPNRKFIREGTLLKLQDSRAGTIQIIQLFLLSDKIIYCTCDSGGMNFKYAGQIPLYSVTIGEKSGGDLDNVGVHSFTIFYSGKYSMTVLAIDEQSKLDWVSDITKSLIAFETLGGLSRAQSVALSRSTTSNSPKKRRKSTKRI